MDFKRERLFSFSPYDRIKIRLKGVHSMAVIKVRGIDVDVDILAELNNFSWHGVRMPIREKFIACSPFRSERRPSFFVNLSGEYAGTWRDSGYIDDGYEKGNFVKLLAYLRNETEPETEEYLLETYGAPTSWDDLTLNIDLSMEKRKDFLPFETLKTYAFRHPYLERRGIPERIQRGLKIGYDPQKKAVVIPWFDPMGRLGNIKFRSVKSKVFWYQKDAAPVRDLVYGMHVIYKKGIEEAVLVEAEIDAMTWWSYGIPAIAAGGTSISDKQASIIKRSPLKRLTVCPDNDESGQKLVENVSHKLGRYIELYITNIPTIFKDVNEAHTNGVRPQYEPRRIASNWFYV